VAHWKATVTRFLESLSVEQQVRQKEKFKNYLNEAKVLKLHGSIELVKQL